MKKAFILGKPDGLKNIIEKHAYQPMEFQSFKEMYKSILSEKPQLIICPKKSNFKKILSHYPFIPVIIYGEKVEKMRGDFLKLELPIEEKSVAEIISQAERVALSDEILWDDQFALNKALIKSKKRREIIIGLLVSVSIILIAVLLTSYIEKRVFIEVKGQTYKLPYLTPSSICQLSEKEILICSWYTSSIYRHNLSENLAIEKIHTFLDKKISVLLLTSSFLFSYDSFEKKIYKHRLDAEFSIVGAYELPIPILTAMAYDGSFFWMFCPNDSKIYKCALNEEFVVISSYRVDKKILSMFFYRQKLLCLTDRNEIQKYRTSPEFKLEKIIILPKIDGEVNSFLLNKNHVFFCNEKKSKLYIYPKNIFPELYF